MKLVDLVGLHVEARSSTPLMLLREQEAPHRVLPIGIGATEAAAIALAFSDEQPPRPLTHDLMATLVDALDAHVDRVEVTGLRDGAFLAEVAVSGPSGERRVDSRSSDAIALAVRLDVPLYASAAVLDEAGATLTEASDDDDDVMDEETIDEEVARFRSFLDSVDPAKLHTGLLGEPPSASSEPGQLDVASGLADDADAAEAHDADDESGPDTSPGDPPDASSA